MADAATFVGWGQLLVGHEREALNVFHSATEYLEELRDEGAISSFEWFLLEPHGGDLAGFLVLKFGHGANGDLCMRPDFQKLVKRAEAVAESVGVVNANTVKAVAAQFGLVGS